MRKIRNIVLGGLQQKIFNLVLITVILVVAAYTAVLYFQVHNLRRIVGEAGEKQQAVMEEVVSSTMNAVVESSLVQSAQMEAYIANSIFAELKGEVMMLGDYAAKLYADPELYPAVEVFLPDPANDGDVSVQLVTAEGTDLTDPKVRAEAELIGNMSDMMETMFDNAQLSSCFIGTDSGLFLITDDRAGAKFDESGQQKPFPVTERPWYTGARESGELYFTDLEWDAFTDEIGIVCSFPIYVDGELVAVVGADLFLDEMARAVADTGEGKGAFTSILNQNGHVLFAPENQDVFLPQSVDEAEDLRMSDEEELAAFVADALTSETDVQLVHAGDRAYYMAGAPMESIGWTVILTVDVETTQEPFYLLQEQYNAVNEEAVTTYRSSLQKSLNTILILLLVVLILGCGSALTLAKRIVKPLNTITERMASLKGKNLQFMMEDTYRTGDEIEVLAESFANLSEKTVRYMEDITRVTAEKERIGAELGMAKAIQASQLPHLFPAFPDRHEFDIYASMSPAKEVGGDFYDFFLVDKDHIGLVMADVSGKGVPAALFMMVARILIRNRIQSGESPSEALRNVNEQLLEGNEAELFVTVWLAVLDIPSGRGVAVNAGHEHPVLCRAGGEYELVVYKHSLAVAVMEGMEFKEHTFQMYPGDSLFVYTDGVGEAANAEEELFGTKRILESLNRDPGAAPDVVLENMKQGISDFVQGAEQFDDITMMCLRYNGPEDAQDEKQ